MIHLSSPNYALCDGFLVAKSRTSLISYFALVSELIIPVHITSISTRCFFLCQNVRSVRFASNSSLVRIEDEAFARSGLQSIVLPARVEILGRQCFWRCGQLCSISFEIPSRLRRIDDRLFASCSELHEICIPASIEILCSRCFHSCLALESIAFESSSRLQRIESRVFAHCPLRFIDLPGGVMTVSPEWHLKSKIVTARLPDWDCAKRRGLPTHGLQVEVTHRA